MKSVSAGVAIDVERVAHDAVGRAVGDAVVKQRGSQVVGDPIGRAVEGPLDVSNGTEAGTTASLTPRQAQTRTQTEDLVTVPADRIDHLAAIGYGGVGRLRVMLARVPRFPCHIITRMSRLVIEVVCLEGGGLRHGR